MSSRWFLEASSRWTNVILLSNRSSCLVLGILIKWCGNRGTLGSTHGNRSRTYVARLIIARLDFLSDKTWATLSAWSLFELCPFHKLGPLALKLTLWSSYACSVTQSCLTLYDPMDCSPSGSSVHGTLQARILGWVAISFSGESSQPRDWICDS